MPLHLLPAIAMLPADRVPCSPRSFTSPPDQLSNQVADTLRTHFSSDEAEMFRQNAVQREPDDRDVLHQMKRVLDGLHNL
ncbi:hypothetical protein AB0878_46235 [Amycolatopsis sp. NPDC047767]|uniref:hypothetical protein n=1 Tax=Amycolatopsis sp. NPDC047767 TaxID=3156765 RepID=UPI003452B2A1